MKKTSILLIFINFLVNISFGQTVTRGPYLQRPNDNSIYIMWSTDSNTDSKVWYGTDSTNLTQTAAVSGNVKRHEVQLTGLTADTKYYYKIGNAAGQFVSTNEQSFKTYPAANAVNPKTRIWVTGDFGTGVTYSNQTPSEEVKVKQAYEHFVGNNPADAWLWLGDNAYNDGTEQQYQDNVFDVPGYSDIFNKLPFWASPGNHDYHEVWDNASLFGIRYLPFVSFSSHDGPYYDIINAPKNAECGGVPSNHELFYSFDHGDVHFISLNTEICEWSNYFSEGTEMLDWLEDDLAQNTKRFTIVFFHHPPYTKGSHDSDTEGQLQVMRTYFNPVFEENSVDLVLAGHSHVYERSFLIKDHTGIASSFSTNQHVVDGSSGSLSAGTPYIKDTLNSTNDGTVYAVVGNSGKSSSGAAINHPAMYHSEGNGVNTCGSMIIDVYKNTLTAQYLRSDTTISDEFSIVKPDLQILPIADVTICEGETIDISALYTGGSANMSYAWSYSSSTDSTVSLSPLDTTLYTLTITDENANDVQSTQFTINVIPNDSVYITEDVRETLTANSSGIDNEYEWFFNGVAIANSDSINLSPSQTGNYYVSIVDSITFCTAISEEYFYVQLPDSVIIDTLNDELYSNFTDTLFTYQWYLDGMIIIGANDTTFIPTESGMYTLGVTYGMDSLFSNSIEIIIIEDDTTSSTTGIPTISSDMIALHPNPVNDELLLSSSIDLGKVSFEILDLNGKSVKQGEVLGVSTSINVSYLPAGMYYLKVNTTNPIFGLFVKY